MVSTKKLTIVILFVMSLSILLSGCSSETAKNLVTKYGQIHDYDLKETFTYFDGTVNVTNYTYIRPAQETNAGLLNGISSIAKSYTTSTKEDTYNGKKVYVMSFSHSESGKNEKFTQIFWIDQESYLPIKMELYASGQDSFFEQMKKYPDALNLAYGENASRDMIFLTNDLGYRIFTVNYEFSNFNTHLDKTLNCDTYDETTGLCIIHGASSGGKLPGFDDIKMSAPNTLFPTYMPNFNLQYVTTAVIQVEAPYITDYVPDEYFGYYNQFSPDVGIDSVCGNSTIYTICHDPKDKDIATKMDFLQAETPNLMFAHLEGEPTESTLVDITAPSGNTVKGLFIKSQWVYGQPTQETIRQATLRWRDGKNTYLLIFNTEIPTTQINNLKDITKEEMIKIAESLKPAKDIN